LFLYAIPHRLHIKQEVLLLEKTLHRFLLVLQGHRGEELVPFVGFGQGDVTGDYLVVLGEEK